MKKREIPNYELKTERNRYLGTKIGRKKIYLGIKTKNTQTYRDEKYI